MNEQEQIIRAYDKALKKLPGSREKNEEYRRYIRSSIQETLAAGPDAGARAVRELLGEPEMVRESYVQSLSPEELALGQSERGKRKKRRRAVLLPLCAIVLVLAGWLVRSHFFPTMHVYVAVPTHQSAERYLERPMLIITREGVFGMSARASLRAVEFMDNVNFLLQQMEEKYPERRHIVCAVTTDNDGTTVHWTGTGTTAAGEAEDVDVQYDCPYRFEVQKLD